MNKINLYLAKNFLIRFTQVVGGFALLIFFINLIEMMKKMNESNAPLSIIATMSLMQVPSFLNDIVSSLVLISVIATFFTLSSRSEITIIRIGGFSLWSIIRPIALSAFCLGIFWVTIFDLLSIQMTKQYNRLEGKYINKESRNMVAPKNGIWLRQTNLENPKEELVIQAKKIYQEDLEFNEITVWFFNQQGEFYKKLDAKKMTLHSGSWLLQDVVMNDGIALNKKLESLTIPTDLEADFVMQKIVNNFQNVKIFSLFELPELIHDLASSGFSPTKFRIYFHSLLSKPPLFAAMSMIACYFSLNHIRNQNTIFLILCGIIVGLFLYIISGLIHSFGSSGLIPVFASTWLIALICLAIGTLLIYQKEKL